MTLLHVIDPRFAWGKLATLVRVTVLFILPLVTLQSAHNVLSRRPAERNLVGDPRTQVGRLLR